MKIFTVSGLSGKKTENSCYKERCDSNNVGDLSLFNGDNEIAMDTDEMKAIEAEILAVRLKNNLLEEEVRAERLALEKDKIEAERYIFDLLVKLKDNKKYPNNSFIVEYANQIGKRLFSIKQAEQNILEDWLYIQEHKIHKKAFSLHKKNERFNKRWKVKHNLPDV